ncbi:MAG: STN domain-containing protein [Steroidobacteraceae bacterium]
MAQGIETVEGICVRLAFSSAVAAALLGSVVLAAAANAPAVREPTRIPQESLGLAIRTLAKERGFQVVYDAGQLDHQSTRGASGDLTIEEALTQILRGTGFTFYKASDAGVVIEPVPGRTDPEATHHPSLSAATQPVAAASNVSLAHSAPPRLYRVTIQATEAQQALRGKAHHFVAAVLARPRGGPLHPWNVPDRWIGPICPVVAGLPKAAGELALKRISDLATYAVTATYAHFQVAGRACHPNLYVVASDRPTRLLEKWWARDRLMYVTRFGMPPVQGFIDSGRPIRAWYNTGLWCTGGAPVGWRNLPGAIDASGRLGFDLPVCMVSGSKTALAQPTYGHPWSNITSAIVVIDLRRIRSTTARQLADYIALVSLADVRFGANPGPVPSILQLFHHGAPPQGLTQWDRALIYSLYDTVGGSREIELDMVRLLRQPRVSAAAGSKKGYRLPPNSL